ncbi:helix-turn-helix transcriptional regulator [Trinickia caryophylli]|uniref:Transcriptional regulator, AraC family n=1 Tax=Trinickia caryophylli TaxID=28094 RepID=A0A1X7G3D9_TRICW|nr:helix-turn-helix transcriptional regulator [Trinickia caryophylli]PMS13746.1 AraC family transcriptional regulator [Trinickia caryophylli]TRX14244.1 AraC family transcriptional regulator [Trinickia caryophylli]WQE14072.1 helix-turn-helix transcriptional regulator [Trinickia caryophylli]SMF63360.1 transcriptional regulator, AraC family [Trinickia caryophylli]GLU33438.1 AraC family transcriptional regulator [Trinickia caryophylli]
MPIFSDASSIDWEDPDLIPRPVITVGAAGLDMVAVTGNDNARQINSRKEADFHFHRKGQFLLWMRGVLTCEVAGGFWLVPPGGAIWVPGGLPHRMEAAGTIECYMVYVDPVAGEALPRNCCTLSTTPLLRELVIRSAALPLRYKEGGMASRLTTLLLDEMALAQPGRVHLPLPTDKRLRTLVEWIMARPSESGSIDSWARRMSISPRTLSRLVSRETGMSFGRWRRQLHILLALQWLAKGATVQDVANGLGYENASNFVVMFRKVLGEPPGRYLKSHD